MEELKIEPEHYAAHRVLSDLITAHKNNEIYYLSDTTSYIFFDENDALFTTNEEIIEGVKKILSDDYELEVIPARRSYEELQEAVLESQGDVEVAEHAVSQQTLENFVYSDIILNLKKKND